MTPRTFNVLEVRQNIGSFYVAAMPAQLLLDVCYAHRMKAIITGEYRVEGTQRELVVPRLREIANYINTPESAFPNSIILAANFRGDDGSIEEDENVRWRVEAGTEGGLRLVIPDISRRLATVIDGQHRLFAYLLANSARQSNDELVCSIFLDLPKPVQAYLFATINSKQTPVNKSLTYELFGYNVDDEPEDRWGPDKLSVFLTRKLNTDQESPLYKRVLVAAENDFVLTRAQAKEQGQWMVSMATIVQGITRLISTNSDADSRWLFTNRSKTRRDLEPGRKDQSVLRSQYLKVNDKLIYLILRNFWQAAADQLLAGNNENTFITRTVGIQALFDMLKSLLPRMLQGTDLSRERFAQELLPAQQVDFSNAFIAEASGRGRTRIRNALQLAMNLKDWNDPSIAADVAAYRGVMKPAAET